MSFCCFWQPLKKKNEGKKKGNKNSNSRIIGYYGDWGIDENIDFEQHTKPENRKGKASEDGNNDNSTFKFMINN